MFKLLVSIAVSLFFITLRYNDKKLNLKSLKGGTSDQEFL